MTWPAAWARTYWSTKSISTRSTPTRLSLPFHLGQEFVVTTSLTKVYGLSGLRCGWILAHPDVAHAMWRLNDLFASIPAHPAELLSVIALENLDQIRQRARRIVEADRVLLEEFLTRQKSDLGSAHRIWHHRDPAPDK